MDHISLRVSYVHGTDPLSIGTNLYQHFNVHRKFLIIMHSNITFSGIF